MQGRLPVPSVDLGSSFLELVLDRYLGINMSTRPSEISGSSGRVALLKVTLRQRAFEEGTRWADQLPSKKWQASMKDVLGWLLTDALGVAERNAVDAQVGGSSKIATLFRPNCLFLHFFRQDCRCSDGAVCFVLALSQALMLDTMPLNAGPLLFSALMQL